MNYPARTWLKDAMETGEIFPGRPVVRPRVDFGQAKKIENEKSCQRMYAALKRFTVQCCCPYPKILGISVMEKSEGVSTALSFFCHDSKDYLE